MVLWIKKALSHLSAALSELVTEINAMSVFVEQFSSP